jgi:hypothetical protein
VKRVMINVKIDKQCNTFIFGDSVCLGFHLLSQRPEPVHSCWNDCRNTSSAILSPEHCYPEPRAEPVYRVPGHPKCTVNTSTVGSD